MSRNGPFKAISAAPCNERGRPQLHRALRVLPARPRRLQGLPGARSPRLGCPIRCWQQRAHSTPLLGVGRSAAPAREENRANPAGTRSARGHRAVPCRALPYPPPAGTRGAGRWHQRSATAGTSPDGDVGSNEGRGLSCYGVGPCGSARRGQEKNGAGGEVAWISGVGDGLPGAALVHPDEDPQRERSAGICGSGGCHSAGIDGAE